MNQQPVTVNRNLVGVIGLLLLAAAGALTVAGAEGTHEMWSGACLKVGLVMAAFWLALPSITSNPELGRASWGALLGAIAVALVVARTRVPLKIVLPVLAASVLAARILRPRRTAPTRPRR
jgi:ABC-type molybdate transport system permease subunit